MRTPPPAFPPRSVGTPAANVWIPTRPEELRRPGHVFPLVARRGGVLTRNGHTEATVDLCRLAGLEQCGLCCEIMRDDGTMMRTSELMEKAREWGLKIITIKDLQDYCRRHDKHVVREACAKMPTRFGEFRIYGYVNDLTGEHHVALVKGRDRRWQKEPALPRTLRVPDRRRVRFPPLRLRSAAGGSHAADRQRKAAACCSICARKARGIGLINKLKAYELQEKGLRYR